MKRKILRPLLSRSDLTIVSHQVPADTRPPVAMEFCCVAPHPSMVEAAAEPILVVEDPVARAEFDAATCLGLKPLDTCNCSARDKDLFVSLCIFLQGCRLSVAISTLQFSQMDERKVTAFCFPVIVFHWPCCVWCGVCAPSSQDPSVRGTCLIRISTGLSCIGDCKICRYNAVLHIEEKNLRPHRFSIGPTYLSQAQVYRAQNGKFSLPQV